MRYRLPRVATIVAFAALIGPVGFAHAQDAAGGTGGAQPTAAPSAPLTPGGLRGGAVHWHGSLPGAQGSAVRVERLDPASGPVPPLPRAPVSGDGSFDASLLVYALGSYTVRSVLDDGTQVEA